MNKKWWFASVFLLMLALSFSLEEAVTREDCTTNGDCEVICGEPGMFVCQYMNCGSGTQLCSGTNSDNPEMPPDEDP